MRNVLVSSFLLLGALGGGLAMAHCGSFTEASEPAAEGGTLPGADGAAAEAAAGPDAAAAADGGGTTGAEGGAFGGCATAITDDFERAAVAKSIWPLGPQILDGGALAIDTADPFAGQSSLRVDVPTGTPRAYLEASLGSRSRVRYAFAMRADGAPARTIVVNSLELDTGGVHFSLYFALDTGALKLREQRFDQVGDPTMDHDVGLVLPGWHTYALTLDLQDGAPAQAALAIDGAAMGGIELTFPMRPGTVAVRCGVGFSDNGPATHVWLDDVTVCAEP